MNLNPELQRQLYLECSGSRLIGVPLTLWLIFTLCYYIDGYQLGGFTARAAFTLYMLITLLWGARQCMDSMLEEIREHTWDIQLLSALQPWRLVFGKLLGSTVMVWYAGLLCLTIYSLATPDKNSLPIQLFYCLGAGLFVQSASLLLGQLAAQRGQTKAGTLFLPVIIGFFYIAPKLTGISSFSDVNKYLWAENDILWYGMRFDAGLFYPASLLLALFWSYAGNIRLMTRALGMRCLPWVWLAFNVCLLIYTGGFSTSEYGFALSGFLVSAALIYTGLFINADNVRSILYIRGFIEAKSLRRCAEELPLWCISFAVAAPFALQLSLSAAPITALTTLFHFYPAPLLLLILRDCGLYLFFSLDKNPQRALGRTLLSLALLYAIIPGIFSFSSQIWLASLVFPLWADTPESAMVSAIVQIALLGRLLFKRIAQVISLGYR
ncbi:MAG: ABC transporter permease [Methylomonas sp.]|jgi:hypothetical protein